MNELINIQGTEISIKEYKGQRVVTFKDIDAVHGRPDGTARKRFWDNKDRFIENEDFFKVSASEIRTSNLFEIPDKASSDYALITEQGYLMLVKSFTDDLAWEVQRSLVNSYFKVRDLTSDLSPQLQLMMQMVNQMAQTERQVKEVKALAEKTAETAEAIKEAVQPVFDDWRKAINDKVVKITKKSDKSYAEMRDEMYRELERRAGCDLGTRLRNLRNRLSDKGGTKTEVEKLCKMDVIESDKRLKEIFSKIVTEYEIRFCA